MQMLSPWGVESTNQDYSFTSWFISSYVSEELHMRLPRVCVHFWAHTALIQGSAHLTPPRPQHSWLISHSPMGLCGSHVGHKDTEGVLLCKQGSQSHGTTCIRERTPSMVWRLANVPSLALPREAACEQQCLLLPPVQLCSQSSQLSHQGSLLPMMTLDLVTLVYELGSQLWHTGSVWGRKQALFLNLMEIYFGSQDVKLPFFMSCLTGRCYFCAQSHRTALDETCTSSCQ